MSPTCHPSLFHIIGSIRSPVRSTLNLLTQRLLVLPYRDLFSTSLKKKIQCNIALLFLLSFVEPNKAFSTVAIAHNYTAFNSSVLAHIKVQRSLWNKKDVLWQPREGLIFPSENSSRLFCQASLLRAFSPPAS